MERRRWWRGGLRFALAATLPAVAQTSAWAGEATAHPSVAFNVRITHEATAGAVLRSLDGAFRRLGEAHCQQVFSDFHDLSGRRLQEALDSLGATGQSYLGLVIFYDGARQERCRTQGNLAVASPGSRVVHICPERFREQARRDPFVAEAILIHEVLHSLGLGENPPSSREITSRVTSRCRR